MKIIATLAFISAISASQLVTENYVHDDQQQLESYMGENRHVHTMENEDGSLKEQVILSPNEIVSKKISKETLPNGVVVGSLSQTRVFKSDGINREDFKRIAAGLDTHFVKKLLEAEDNRILLHDVNKIGGDKK